MSQHDGNGWVECRCGERHWGRHGAAGLLVADSHRLLVLLQLRAEWTHLGGTWGLPGGARDSHEDVATAAIREAGEEVGLQPDDVVVRDLLVGTDHGDWAYTYALAEVISSPATTSDTSPETEELGWFELDSVAELPLHPGLAADWPGLAGRVRQLWSGAARRSP